MGNKTGKFNVPATEKANKDEQVGNDNEPKLDSSNTIEQNGDHPKLESNSIEKAETAPEVKKKSIVSWFKKVSLRKEKKPKAPRENGVKEEVVDSPKENGVVEELNETVKENSGNGDVKSEKVECKEPHSREIVTQEANEVDAADEPTVTIEHKEETITSTANEHDNTTDVTETAAEEQ